jgi:hypothetical protein
MWHDRSLTVDKSQFDSSTPTPKSEKIAKTNRIKHWSKRLSPNRPQATESTGLEFLISLVRPV